ncbi:MAG: T9SS type A sorting domain-containing protein [Bacteriodetes bacterium]|nr:T9SS type A sorting domain-containing protein [Bacteroidota bacterium]
MRKALHHRIVTTTFLFVTIILQSAFCQETVPNTNKNKPTSIRLAAVLHNDTILVASGTGLFRYTAITNLWNQVNFPTRSIFGISKTHDGTIYVATGGYGLYKSSDNTLQNWTTLISPSTQRTELDQYWQITINNNYLYLSAYGKGVQSSNDDGITWTALNNGLIDTDITCLSSSSNELYAGTDSHGVLHYNLTNNQWESVSQTSAMLPTITALSIQSNGTIIAGGLNEVYSTTNNGETWNKSVLYDIPHNVLNYQVFQFATDNTGTVYAATSKGVYVTNNKGITWKNFNNNTTTTRSITHNDDYIYGSTDNDIILLTTTTPKTEVTETTFSPELSYNNPVSNMLRINFSNQSTTIKSIEIYTVNGDFVTKAEANDQSNSIQANVSELATGMYLTKVSTTSGNHFVTLIKQ